MFRFTIRDVLWLTTLAAVLVAWWIDRHNLLEVNAAVAAAKAAAERDARDMWYARVPWGNGYTAMPDSRRDELWRKYIDPEPNP